ncbi:MAG: metallophosphoesterase [Eubacteriales bacterium]|nr:metallophosphoesterase [Eubacteriales bacterium]
MKILIVSDTHGRDGNLIDVLDLAGPVDMLVHCGDVEGSEDFIREIAGCPVHMVAGNNDFFTDLPREEEFLIGDYQVWLTHGHNYYVSVGDDFIREEAASRGADIVMYGHTHRPLIELAKEPGEVTAINPGSISYPRQEGRRPSYILMELDREGKAHYHLNFL